MQLNRFVGEDAEAVSSNWEAARELQRSIAADTEGVTITSVFDAGLSDLIHYSTVVKPERGFAVRDQAGDVPIEGWTADRDDRVVLHLGRPLEGQATVTGAPTANPPHLLRIDVPGYRPILGFTVSVEP